MKLRTALRGIVAGALIGAAGFLPNMAWAAVPDPAFVDLAISVGTLNLSSASAGQTTMFFTTPGMLKPSGDVTVEIRLFQATSMSVNGRACSFFLVNSTYRCVVRNSELPTGVQIRSVRLNVQTTRPHFIPRNETWSAKLLISDGDSTNNSSSARVVRA